MSSKKNRRKEKNDSEEDIPSDESDGPAAPVSTSAGGERRSSGRLRQLNKKGKQIDGETRAEVRNARLESLENDKWTQEVLNTGDVDHSANAAADDEYKEDEDEAFSPATKRRAKRSTTKDKERDKGPKKNAAFRLVRSLNRILDELEAQTEDKADPTIVNYHTIAAGPSMRPARHFCAVCGFPSDYHCVRCGTSFCSLKCNQTHRDISCLKFGA